MAHHPCTDCLKETQDRLTAVWSGLTLAEVLFPGGPGRIPPGFSHCGSVWPASDPADWKLGAQRKVWSGMLKAAQRVFGVRR